MTDRKRGPTIPAETGGDTEPEELVPSASFTGLLHRYAERIRKLTNDFSLKNLIGNLHLRDGIEACVRRGEPVNEQCMTKLLEHDKELLRLGHRAYGLRRDLVRFRRCLRPSPDAWWWFLDHHLGTKLRWAERIALSASLILFPFSLGFALELTRRYGNNGVGWESLLPIAATLLGSLSLGGMLSVSFRNRVTSILEARGWSIRLRPVVVCVVLALLAMIAALWWAQPSISAHYNRQGTSRLTLGRGAEKQLSEASTDFERAVRFDPSNAVAHYNLGRVSEDLLQDERAATEYQIAFDAGLDLAANNLGHLFLLRKEYDRAAFVLQRSALDSPKNPDRALRHAALKNLGWARWGQHRFAEARALLDEATRVDPNQAEAHCLLAKTLDALGDPAAARQWRSCLGFSSQNLENPAADIWVGEARAYLESAPRGGAR